MDRIEAQALKAAVDRLLRNTISMLSGSLKEKYVKAIHWGMDRDYRPMEEIFSLILERTLSAQKR